ncbi:NADH-quinone oxidoreductase subunit C [Peribacillus asahii]|uniref:NADH-quinone oxidoreductase subunit C n=1 Tax=Peribacillus asahii TaxID=228899 RepID=UPI00220DEE9D|nr:NADH-quinone oxidoreductase subunit C [Peribacillus asahii]
MDENELTRLKKEAAEKAKAAAIKRRQEKERQASESGQDLELAKKKAAAAAKAKAAAAAKAKAKAASTETKEEASVEPSPNEPFLQHYIQVIARQVGADSFEEYYINRLSKDVPTILAKPHTYMDIAQVLKQHLHFDFLAELHGTDFETHMEVYVYLCSLQNGQSVVLKVKLDRDNPIISSLVPLWKGADWPECETYDLLGIQFSGHPNLKRILLGEDWIGYPLRKDYKPHDEEV